MEFDFNKYFDYHSLESGEQDNLLTTEKLENYQKILKADNIYVIYASDYRMMRDRFDEVISNENPINDYFVGKLVKVIEYSFTPFRVQLTDGGVIDCNEIYILDEDFLKGKQENDTEKPITKFDGSKIIDMSSPNLLQCLNKEFLGAYSIEGIMNYFQGIDSGRKVFKGTLLEYRPDERFAGFRLKLKDTAESVFVTYLYPLKDIDESKVIDITSPNLDKYLGKRILGAYSVDAIRDYFQGINSDRIVFEGTLLEYKCSRLFPFKIKLKDMAESTCVSCLYLLEDIEINKSDKDKITDTSSPNYFQPLKKEFVNAYSVEDIKETKRLVIERDKDTVEVLILPNKDGKGYQYINLTKGHICPCVFPTMKDALKDLEKFQNLGKIKSWVELPYGWGK